MSLPVSIEVKQGKRFLARDVTSVRIGKGTGAGLRVEDPLLEDLHFAVHASRGGFHVEDLGTATGTWVDGRRADQAAGLRDGARIVAGTTEFTARIETRDQARVLVLELEKSPFHLKRYGTTESDPNLWVRDELAMSRFPKLSVGNRTAAVVATVLAIAGLIGLTVLEPLVDAGPLLCTHAALFDGADTDAVRAGLATRGEDLDGYRDRHARFVEIAREQGCASCHDGGRLTEAKCMQCHDADFRGPVTAGADAPAFRHPYVTASGALDGLPAMGFGSEFCMACHIDHERPSFVKASTADLGGDCAHCHRDATRDEMVARYLPPELPERDRRVATYRFPHDIHLARDMACDVCHVEARDGRLDTGQHGSPANPVDFARVEFETVCAACHVTADSALAGGADPELVARIRIHDDALEGGDRIAKAWRPDPASGRQAVWKMDWHGTTDAATHCARCHAATDADDTSRFGPGLRLVERFDFDVAATLANKARYELSRRPHTDEFENHSKGGECSECHRRTDLVSERRSMGTFWHALHMPRNVLSPVDPADQQRISDAACAQCHDDVAAAERLVAGDWWRWTPAANRAMGADGSGDERYSDCRGCHDTAKDDPDSIVAAPIPDRSSLRTVRQPDFPHDAHPSDKIEGGCFACHSFPERDAEFEFERVVLTDPQARNCMPCHQRHQQIQDDSCAVCHPGGGDGGELAQNVYTIAAGLVAGSEVATLPGRGRVLGPAPTRRAAADPDFDHFSPGHLPRVRDIDGLQGDAACDACHDPERLGASQQLGDVHIPNEAADAWSCRECHLDHQYHWRAKQSTVR